ncbi:MAG: type I methionyl aminopeptidase [Clostridiales bacterium]|nr:type I methionyl aminopeptidase [Clostridiales bacterium]
MLTIKTKSEIAQMQKACTITEKTLLLLRDMVEVGITTEALDKEARRFIESFGAVPSFLNYNGYPKSVCISVNEQVVHGIPDGYKLRDGDIVSCDVGANIDGYHGDAARTFIVGNASEEAKKLVQVTRESFFHGIEFAKVGNRISDISKAIQAHAEQYGYGVVRDLIGHGVGTRLHEKPDIPNYYVPRMGLGVRLVEGMTLAIEPMINMGTFAVNILKNGWTVVSADNSLSAHYENTIAITDGEPIILTMQLEDA